MEEKGELLEIKTPELVLHVKDIGENSLLGKLCLELKRLELLNKIYAYNPDGIKFILMPGSKLSPNLDIYKEINLVREFLQIEEWKIKFIIS